MGSWIGMQSVEDLRILAEMADEIQKHGVVALPGSLRGLLKTHRGLMVGFLLEKLSKDLSIIKWQYKEEIEKLTNKNNDLRDEMQLVIDRLEKLESDRP